MELRYQMVASKSFVTMKEMKESLVIENNWTKDCLKLGK